MTVRSPAFSPDELKEFSLDSEIILSVLDKSAKMLKVSNAWEDKFNISEENITKDSLYDFAHADDISDLKAAFEKAVDQGFISQHITRFVDDDLTTFYVQFDLRVKEDVVYFVGFDVSKSCEEHEAFIQMSKMSKSGAWYHDPIRNTTYCSDEVYRIHELKLGEKIDSETFLNFYDEPYRSEIKGHIEKLYEEGKPYDHTGEITTTKGRKKWVRTKATPTLHQGKVIFVNGVTSDETRFRKYLLKLEELAETQNLALQGVKSGLFDYRVKENLVFFSESFRKMLGLDPERTQVPLEEFRELIFPEDQDEAMKRFSDGLHAPGNHHFNHYRVVHSNGEINHYEVHGWRKKDGKGRTTRMIGNLINVNERILLQDEVLRAMRSLEAMVNNGFIYSLLLDTRGAIVMADKRSVEVIKKEYGVDPEKQVVFYHDVMPSAFQKSYKASFEKALSGETDRKEIERPLLTGAMQWLDIMYRPVFDEEGKVEFVLTNGMDVSERKKAEVFTKMAEEKARALNRLKSVILSNLSHEIRTPLNGIMGATDLLMEKIDDASQVELLEAQKDSSLRILKQLTDLISLGDLETLREGLNMESYKLNKLTKLTYKMYLHQAKLKGLELTLQESVNKLRVKVDKELFVSALSAIVNNAIKYTSEGGIEIKISNNAQEAFVEISDSGSGIKEENFERIFEDFEQESFGLHQKYEGAGIGLSVAKKFLELLGAKLNLKSEVGRGSTFTVSLPLYHEDSDS